MKVTCPFCDSYIEADENMNCPNCGGSVSAEVKEAEDLYRRQEEERRINEEKTRQKQAEDERDEHLFEVIIAAIASVFGGRHGRGLLRIILNAVTGRGGRR
jgi:hypothetical protein